MGDPNTSFPGNSSFRLDMHDWTEDEQECPIKSSDGENRVHKHFMGCGKCGIRRHGAYAEHGAYHYFAYDQPHGRPSEFVPPCSPLPDPSIGVVDELKICTDCGHVLDHPWWRHEDCKTKGVAQIDLFCRALNKSDARDQD